MKTKKEEAQERLEAIQNEVEMLKKIINEPENIMDRIKTFSDACKELGMVENIFNDSDTKDEIAYKKLKIIIKALNEGWKPNWNNSKEYKYIPWHNMSPFGFGDSNYDIWNTDSVMGSCLCYKSRELAVYAGKQFEDIYKDFLS
jgi:hypothetical protein